MNTRIALITRSYGSTLKAFHHGMTDRADETGVEAPALAYTGTDVDVISLLNIIDAPTEAESRNARFICGD